MVLEECLVFKIKKTIFLFFTIYLHTAMDEKEIFELYKNLKRGFDTSDWDLILESIDYLSEYIDLNDDDETFDELN